MCYSGRCPHEDYFGECNLKHYEMIEYHEQLECPHLHVTVKWKLYARETRYEPAGYVGKAFCDDCGAEMEPEDIPEEAERKDETI